MDRNSKQILWENLVALMKRDYGKENLTRLAEDAKIGPGTSSRLKAQQTSVGIDVLDALAVAFKVEPWQLMVPGLDAAKPQQLITLDEADLYAKLRDVVAQQSAQIHGTTIGLLTKGGDTTPQGLARRLNQHKDFGSPYHPHEEPNAERDVGKKKGK